MTDWISLAFPPLREDVNTDVDGGCITALDVDLQSKPGSVLARKDDALLFDPPGNGTAIPEDLKQTEDARNDTKPYALLTRGEIGGNITAFHVRGFKDLNGEELTPVDDGGWYDTGITLDVTDGNLQHDGHEVRVHCDTPKYFGLPRSVIDTIGDFGYSNHNNTLHFRPFGLSIVSQIAEDNYVRAPRQDELRVVCDPGNTIGNNVSLDGQSPMWGNPKYSIDAGGDFGNVNPRFRYAYWGASYLYDGYQESPLYVFPEVTDFVVTGDDPEGRLRARVILHIDGVTIGSDTQTRLIPKRVRKIRFYCAGARKLLSDPRKDVVFRLVNEIDVKYWDRDSEHVVYRGPAKRSEGSLNGVHAILLEGLDRSHTGYGDDGIGQNDPFEDFSDTDAYRRTSWFRVVGYDDEFPIVAAYIGSYGLSLYTTSGYDSRLLEIWTNPSSDENPTIKSVRVFHTFEYNYADVDLHFKHLSHRNYVGQELLNRPTYTELSGLPQSLTISVSPPRRWGTNKASYPMIGDVTDSDGKRHPYRVQWPHINPAALLCPDIFPPENYKDFDFPVIYASRAGANQAIWGRNTIIIGSVRGDASSWDFTDVRDNVGCVSRKSIVETPNGTFFLSHDGVRVLRGLSISDPISFPVRETLDTYRAISGAYDNAVGWYYPTFQQYALQFQTEDGLRTGVILVYDAVIDGWFTVSPISDSLVGCATTDVDGNALIGLWQSDEVIPNVSGIYTYCGSDDFADASYVVKTHFGDPLTEKHIRHIKAFFTQSGFGNCTLLVACENQNAVPGQTASATRNATLNLTSGERTTKLDLQDRLFQFSFSNFSNLKKVMVEVEAGERTK